MAKKDSTLTKEYLHSLFDYKDGNLYWKINRYGASRKKPAGSVNSRKYHVVYIDYKQYSMHRIIFLMHHGYLPKIIDHIDGNPENNKIENLREANVFQNCQNSKINKRNTSGSKNVTFCKTINKWRVSVNGKRMSFGNYDDIELADLVAQEVRDKYHKEFVKHY
jgi:molybdenum cofactor biosynthesis enzyme MoaA